MHYLQAPLLLKQSNSRWVGTCLADTNWAVRNSLRFMRTFQDLKTAIGFCAAVERYHAAGEIA